jgi:AraC family transcriptional regulator
MRALAITGPEISTRAADAATVAFQCNRDYRDFFVLKTTVAAAYRALQRSGLDASQFCEPRPDSRFLEHRPSPQRELVLAVQRNIVLTREPGKNSRQIVPYPHGALSLVNLLLDPTTHSELISERFNFLIPRAAFDQLADEHGADRIVELDVKAGVAAGDPIVLHLGNCLMPAIERHAEANNQFVDRVTAALNIHFARVYGGMHLPRPFVSGGLTPYQLRLARDMINANLDGELSLEKIARACKLSVSHFARAFTRSTGVSPHRWLMQRRVDAAKDMLLTTGGSLVEISLKCGFSDQSHFTRVFAEATGETPGRWRRIQLN